MTRFMKKRLRSRLVVSALGGIPDTSKCAMHPSLSNNVSACLMKDLRSSSKASQRRRNAACEKMTGSAERIQSRTSASLASRCTSKARKCQLLAMFARKALSASLAARPKMTPRATQKRSAHKRRADSPITWCVTRPTKSANFPLVTLESWRPPRIPISASSRYSPIGGSNGNAAAERISTSRTLKNWHHLFSPSIGAEALR
mmetsp:Transcript_66995/g.143283  ORF Transcript_66995/g.143283 Transcript_66995/m.143283 type:complete len:202 (-) Transcript_66995:123-728(-)